jgi:hypothetical protein
MTWTLSNSGTTAALTIGTETTLSSDTNNATFAGFVDTSNLASGDTLEIRVYTINLSGGSYTQTWKGAFQNAQLNPIKAIPPIVSDQGYRVTLKQTAGTGRTYGWKYLRQ